MNPDPEIKELTLKLLEPYIIPEDCPYLSEDQRGSAPYPLKRDWSGWRNGFTWQMSV